MEKQKTKYRVIAVFDGDAEAIDVFTDMIAHRWKHRDCKPASPPRRSDGRTFSKTNRKTKVSVEAGTVIGYNKGAVRHGQTHASGLCG